VLQSEATDILQTVPAEATYEDIFGAFRDRFGDHQLAAVYRSQLKARVQTSGETLQEFAAAVEQMAPRALVELPVAFIQKGVTYAFIDRLRDREVKRHLLMGGDRTINEALKLEAATGPAARVRELTLATARASQPSDRRREGRLCAGSASPPDTCAETAGECRVKRETRIQRKRENAGEERGPPLSLPLNSRFTLNMTHDSIKPRNGSRESHVGCPSTLAHREPSPGPT